MTSPAGATAPLNTETGTYFFPNWLVDAIICDLSQVSRKLYLIRAYTNGWICREQVAAFFAAYGLEDV